MPENASYMYAAYGAATAVFIGYVVSLVARARAMARRGHAIATASRQ